MTPPRDDSMPFCLDHTVMMTHLVNIAAHTGKIDAISDKLTGIEGRLDGIEEHQNQMTVDIANLKTQTASQEQRITATQNFINNIKANWPTILTIITALVAFKLKG